MLKLFFFLIQLMRVFKFYCFFNYISILNFFSIAHFQRNQNLTRTPEHSTKGQTGTGAIMELTTLMWTVTTENWSDFLQHFHRKEFAQTCPNIVTEENKDDRDILKTNKLSFMYRSLFFPPSLRLYIQRQQKHNSSEKGIRKCFIPYTFNWLNYLEQLWRSSHLAFHILPLQIR